MPLTIALRSKVVDVFLLQILWIKWPGSREYTRKLTCLFSHWLKLWPIEHIPTVVCMLLISHWLTSGPIADLPLIVNQWGIRMSPIGHSFNQWEQNHVNFYSILISFHSCSFVSGKSYFWFLWFFDFCRAKLYDQWILLMSVCWSVCISVKLFFKIKRIKRIKFDYLIFLWRATPSRS